MELFDEMLTWLLEWLQLRPAPVSLRSLGLPMLGLWGFCTKCDPGDQWSLWAGEDGKVPVQFVCPSCGNQWIRVLRSEPFP